MKTLQEMREAVENKIAQILTLDLAKELKGKKIATIYFGYRGQDGIDEFVVGEVKPEVYGNGKEGEICLFTPEGRNTFIRAHKFNEGAFTCSDNDRFVYFVELPSTYYHIQHNTKGFYGGNGNWITRNWQNAKSYSSVEAAEREARTLKALDGKLLKKLQIISFYKKEKYIHFPSSRLHKEVSNEN